MKKRKYLYITIISLLIIIPFSSLITAIKHKIESQENGRLTALHQKIRNRLQKIHLNFKKIDEGNYNTSFLRSEISYELAKIDKLTP